MARIGGRNVVFAWIVGVFCAGVIGVLAFLTVPLVTTGMGMLGAGADEGAAAAAADGPQQCRELYPEALWVTLQYSPGAQLEQTQDAPVSTATALVEALAPEVRFTCAWTSDAGSISTTVGSVGTDAGSIAASALPAQGFTCDESGVRTLCSRTDGDLVETIEAGEGHWVSTSQSVWHPEQYASRVGNAVFAPSR
ncbi:MULTISPECIES: hypothetical protein [Microbacterium]|uniref:hypothetical protein n=1 Tax=Microbacterium TaxID=33882 RepID=UPI000E708D92|nr:MULTISPECIES: hypothetical protein [Microbacterium]RKE65036.1 hypothetical protein DEU36_2273 [Microbacterium sp. AG238]WJM15394.1 hypothetical protein QUC20_14110 [Microbacterium arborescens]